MDGAVLHLVQELVRREERQAQLHPGIVLGLLRLGEQGAEPVEEGGGGVGLGGRGRPGERAEPEPLDPAAAIGGAGGRQPRAVGGPGPQENCAGGVKSKISRSRAEAGWEPTRTIGI